MFEYESPERQDQAGLFGESDEVMWHEQTAARVVPAGQRLEVDGLLREAVDEGLVADLDAVVQDRFAQFGLEVENLGRTATETSVAVPTAGPLRLGFVHRQVGVVQQI